MKDYKEIESLENYAKALTVLVAIIALFTLLAMSSQSIIVGILCGLVTFVVGYMGICVLRVFAGIARDIRDMRNKGC